MRANKRDNAKIVHNAMIRYFFFIRILQNRIDYFLSGRNTMTAPAMPTMAKSMTI